jgi:hypothetical protein
MTDFSATLAKAAALLAARARIDAELRALGVLRSENALDDFTEFWVSGALRLDLAANSAKGFDAVDGKGVRYQIKGRRPTKGNPSRQLSALRDLDAAPFDYLVGVLFNADCTVMRAALIPLAVVQRLATFIPRANNWRFRLEDAVWAIPGVIDLTGVLKGEVG